mmetsp:Transcript_6041/g.21329  ORF Transcript_6041/g.21329 Transcript_6041/m.21329 type:complete len:312 (+) Transcript_6041:581-1516(+)
MVFATVRFFRRRIGGQDAYVRHALLWFHGFTPSYSFEDVLVVARLVLRLFRRMPRSMHRRMLPGMLVDRRNGFGACCVRWMCTCGWDGSFLHLGPEPGRTAILRGLGAFRRCRGRCICGDWRRVLRRIRFGTCGNRRGRSTVSLGLRVRARGQEQVPWWTSGLGPRFSFSRGLLQPFVHVFVRQCASAPGHERLACLGCASISRFHLPFGFRTCLGRVARRIALRFAPTAARQRLSRSTQLLEVESERSRSVHDRAFPTLACTIPACPRSSVSRPHARARRRAFHSQLRFGRRTDSLRRRVRSRRVRVRAT